MSDINPVEIPEVDTARDAVHAIRGYAYQLYATAQAWARLGPEATLHVERGNDYLTVATQALAGVEVKSTEGSGSATLRSTGVVTQLNRFWRLAQANPDRATSMIYLTTSPAGVEQGSPFGSKVPGLDYWRLAATGAPLAPLRTLLQELDLDECLATWLRNAPDAEVRERLLRPLRFACGEPRLAELADLVADALVDVGARLSLLPSDCRDAVPAVILHLMRLATQQGDRAVTRANLHEILERVGSSRVSNAVLQRLQQGLGQPADPGAIDARDMPTDDLVVERAELLASLAAQLSEYGLLWLTGASGLGKTGLALKLAAARNGRWWIVELDPQASSGAITGHLRRAQRLTLDPDFGGVILDDLPQNLDRRAATALRRLTGAARHADGSVVITAYNPPSPTLAGQLAPGAEIVREAPYFTEADVAAYVSREGGDPKVWAKLTHIYCGAGHPQFVAARVQGLKRRGWPEDEIGAGFAPASTPTEIEAERSAIHARLVRELPDHAKAMLYRLSVPSLGFDRRLALATAAVAPAINLPGEALDILLGPWVERRELGRMRVSPLAAQSGANALAPAELMAVHLAVSRDLAARRPLDARTFDQLMLSGLIAKDPIGLFVLAAAIIRADWETQTVLADYLAALLLLRLDQLILPEDLRTSWYLRMAQLKLCVRGERPERAVAVYHCLIGELGDAADADIHPFRRSAMAAIALMPENPMAPDEWFSIVRQFEGVPIAEEPGSRRLGRSPVEDQAQMLFLWRASHVRNVADLEGIFGALDAIPAAVRRHYLNAFADPATGLRSLVQPAWVQEAKSSDFSAKEVATRYGRLQAIAERWEEPDLVVECVCSRVVLLAEYAHDEAGALALLGAAGQRFPGRVRLAREHTKLMIRAGRHAEAARILETVLSEIAQDDIVERFHILRDIAVSAAKGGDFTAAATRFEEAAKTAQRGPTLQAVAAGLYADLAVVQLKLDQPCAAGENLFRATNLADGIDPDDPVGQFRLSTVVGITTWVWSVLTGHPLAEPVFGAASSSPPNTPLPGMRATPLLLWYQLRMVELALGCDLGAKARLDAHRVNGVSPYFEGVELRETVSWAIGHGDLEAFLNLLSAYCRHTAYMKATAASTEERALRVAPEPPWEAFALDLEEPAQLYAGRMAVAAFAMRAAADGHWEVLERLGARLATDPATAHLAPMVALKPGDLENLLNSDLTLTPALTVLFGADPMPDPNLLQAASVRTWEWVRTTPFIEVIGAQIGQALAAHWRRRLEEGAFALHHPRLHGPAILAATAKVEDGPSLARLVLAAAPTVQLDLPADMIALLRKEAGSS